MVVKPMPVQRAVYYRESDGKPMAESDLHRDEMFELVHMLRAHFEARGDVYVSGNNFLYFEEGQPRSVISPDVYVVFGIARQQRRVFKLWEEGHSPAAVFEVSSRKTWRQDLGAKRDTFARLGVAEYWLYDPERDYLDPPLQGYALQAAGYVGIAPDGAGRIASKVLGLELDLDAHGLVRLFDMRTGRRLLRSRELEGVAVRAERKAAREAAARAAAEREAAREAAARAAAEREAAREAVARAAAERVAAAALEAVEREVAARAAADAEVERLREEVERLRGEGSPRET